MTEIQKLLKDDYYPADYPYQKRIAKSGDIRLQTNFLPLTKNDNCEQLGVITKGLENLSMLPTIKVKLNDLASDEETNLKYEIECKNIQERPPNESFNSIGKVSKKSHKSLNFFYFISIVYKVDIFGFKEVWVGWERVVTSHGKHSDIPNFILVQRFQSIECNGTLRLCSSIRPNFVPILIG